MTILYFVLAAFALGVLVFIHELGHYYVARKLGMVVEVFSIGFGRPLIKWKVRGVDWQFCWIPFGGYVKIKGMELSKKDKNTYVEPYDIPDGFFSKHPFKRLLVTLAGPVANFILAFLIFIALYAMGGREKPFSEFTQIIGWVDPSSQLYDNGLRPGDLITEYDGKPYKSSKDLLYAAMLGDKQVEIKGYHVNYLTGERTPYAYNVETYKLPTSLDGLLTTGIRAPARYLIYEGMINGSPLEGSGIAKGDRIVWADGQYLFSKEELSYLLNSDKALLTVERRGKTFLSRQPRVLAGDMILTSGVKNELSDWQYEAGIKQKWQELKILPYNLTVDAAIEAPLPFIDKEARREAFPSHTLSKTLETPLKAGDRIVAIDGVPISTAYQLIDLLQTHHAQIIVQRKEGQARKISWKDEDQVFTQSIQLKEINDLTKSIGKPSGERSHGEFLLLAPVRPMPLSEFTLSAQLRERVVKELTAQAARIEKIRDPEKKNRALELFEKSKQELLLGIQYEDRKVDYNPNPIILFGSVFTETYQTLKALILGYLNPKWISGPVGIVRVIHHGWSVGIGEALFWIGAISVNLGFLNLLPIPVLDGGYMCMSLWEMITRRRIKAKTMERLIIPFVVLLIAFFIFLTFQDISRLF